jgi:C-terminal processing protease CtpA/Prc
VDLRQLRDAQQIASLLERLAAAPAIIFDVRGFPGPPCVSEVLPRLTSQTLRSNMNNVPIATQPDRREVRFHSISWEIAARAPRLAGRMAFLTDARAISSAETFMAIVETHRLGAIFGERTGGTNGNFAMFRTLTGHHVTWTGMQVLKPDGSRLHGVGVNPTHHVRRTIAGVQAGRDELVEAAYQTLSATLSAPE